MVKKLIILFIITTILVACKTVPTGIKYTKALFEKEQLAQDLFIMYHKDNSDKWQELQSLLANDLMSAKELNVIDCRGFDRASAGLTFIQEIAYAIHDTPYLWRTYRTTKGICIERNILNLGSFFLNIHDSKVLLSASKGYHFNELGIETPVILFKRTILKDLKGLPCGGTKLTYIEKNEVATSACEEIIWFYNDALEHPKPSNIPLF